MPTADEKARRKQIVHEQREEERRKTRQSLPMDLSSMKGLFDYIDSHLESEECDDSLCFAVAYLREQNISERPLLQWLEAHGGHCDCEALANIEPILEDAVPGYSVGLPELPASIT